MSVLACLARAGANTTSEALLPALVRAFATKDVATVAKTNWAAVQIPKQSSSVPTTTGGAAFPNDLRATSALGIGDGLKSHTSKWLQVS